MDTLMGLDYATWWFLILGAVFTGYAILDGFDLGVGMIHLFLRKEESRRIALNAIGPVWDGNEVWIVIGGGALFAGFPVAYASILSAMYVPFMLFLMSLIFRAVSIEFRSKEPMAWWRRMWDIVFALSSYSIAFWLGLILGNVLQGLPLDVRHEYSGGTLPLFNPFALLTALTTIAAFAMHGSLFLIMKTENRLYARMTFLTRNMTIFFVLCFVLLTIYTLLYIPHLTARLRLYPGLFMLPVLVVISIAAITRFVARRQYRYGFVASCLTLALLLIQVATELYPHLLLSTDPAHSLTLYNAASSPRTLANLLIVAAIGVPLVGIYTTFVFVTFRGKVHLDENSY
ncbi:MAG: cytochrome d ubiquinol oxidase subunit II [Bacteroidia bacterium]|nr:cytochrome d ubiquinol oxidase subunit II [Bacteroidia bacterium]